MDAKTGQKATEFACIEAVARATGTTAVPEDEANQWPDGWLEHADGKREPVEVVAAFRRPAGENPKEGSAWLRNWKRGAAATRALHENTGEVFAWHVDDDGLTLLNPADKTARLPVATKPIKPDEWVLQAVRQKVEKNYDSGAPAILIVQLNSPLPLSRFDVERLVNAVRALGEQFKFAALWVINNYGDPPVKIPT